MMTKSRLLAAATLAALLAGPALADGKFKRGDDRYRGQAHSYRHDDRRDDRRHDDRHDPGRQYDRHWRHVPPVHYRSNSGYRLGYEYGWRDAARSCRADYRPGRWYRDRRDSYWYFGFEFDG